MDETSANPLVIALMFLARCLVPLVIMLAVSYVLRRLGFIKEPAPAPDDAAYLGNTDPNEQGAAQHGEA